MENNFDHQIEAILQRLSDKQPKVGVDLVFKRQLDIRLDAEISAHRPAGSFPITPRKSFMSFLTLDLKKAFPFGAVALTAIVAAVVLTNTSKQFPELGGLSGVLHLGRPESSLPTFASCSALAGQLKKVATSRTSANMELKAMPGGPVAFGLGAAAPTAQALAPAAADYSTTNIQVAGVDEADIVKTDGRYIYTVAGSRLTISQAYPVEDARHLASFDVKSGQPTELYIYGNHLVVFGQSYDQFDRRPVPLEGVPPSGTGAGIGLPGPAPTSLVAPGIYPYPGTSLTFAEVYDVSDHASPVLKRRIEVEGNYLTSRKIGKFVYLVANSYPRYDVIIQKGAPVDSSELVPLMRDSRPTKTSEVVAEGPLRSFDFEPVTDCAKVAYLPPVNDGQYLTVLSFSVDELSRPVEKEVILGAGQTVYASLENLYAVKTDYQYAPQPLPLMEGILPRQPYPQNRETSSIFKFSLRNGNIDYRGSGSVPGHVLNQFSLDEFQNHFRIATQTSGYRGNLATHVYVLDGNLKISGSVQDIAPGEQLHSARFMGERGYLVTFKKTDPFFVLDLKDPAHPSVLGKLKLPGYSDYLHPYDDTHIIGIGKDTLEAEQGDFAWYQGLKMALFDVSDPTNPKEIDHVVIGDRGTDSPILSDHKALLFSREKNLLVIPVSLAKISDEQKQQPANWGPAYGQPVFQGSYVFSVDLQSGFSLKGKVSHHGGEEEYYAGRYYGDNLSRDIRRNLYIDDVLYSVSDAKIKANRLLDLSELATIELTERQPEPGVKDIIY